MSVRAIAFDLFGTLVVLEDPLFRRQAPRALGVAPRVWLGAVREVGLRRAFPSVQALAQALAAACGAQGEGAVAALAAGLERQLAAARLVPGVRATCGFLQRRGLQLALVSNLSSAHLQLVDRFQLREAFSLVLASCETGLAKPEEAVFRALAHALALPVEAILVVGDSEAADGAARRFGFPVLLVGRDIPTAAHVGWLALEGSAPLAPLLAPGTRWVAADGTWELRSLTPLADEQQGRYNLVAVAEASNGSAEATWYCKRFWQPASAFVDELARGLARELDLPVPEAVVLEAGEPLLVSRQAPGEPFDGQVDAEVAFDLGSHLAFAYAFANADIRPRNAFVFREGGRRRLALIDFEHCFLNLAIPPEKLPAPQDARVLAALSLAEAQGLAARQVITPKTIVRARNEFFDFRQASREVKQALAEGFAGCWQAMRARQEELLARVLGRLQQEPFLPVGTWRFRRALAPFDVEEMRQRLAQDLQEVLGFFLAEGSSWSPGSPHGAGAP